ncbi:GNAT family N-acetyltransferase [Aestuariivirga litoralis]|nr:GNAT family N-acetyltransferase [Aestuariivirga litoralis]
MTFQAARITPGEARDVWSASTEASAFTCPANLELIAAEVDWWGVRRGNRLIAAWPLIRQQRGGDIGPPPFTYYVGPLFLSDIRVNMCSARAWNAYTGSFRAMVEAVTGAHASFSFSLPLGLMDVRVLSWWNFDHPGEKGFEITPRYSARIDLARHPDEASLLKGMSGDRRRAIAQWSMSPPAESGRVPVERIIELHDQTLRRTGGQITPGRHVALRRMIALAQSGAGTITGYHPDGSEAAEAAVIVVDGAGTANNIFSSTSDAHARSGLSSWVTWQAIRRAHARGLRWFDMNGANSPNRAANKHSYGAGAELYFDCRFSRNP